MGTRGAFGFRIDGEDKVTYNHFDSYPGHLGQKMVEFIQTAREEMTPDELAEKVRNIRLVDDQEESPDLEDIKRYEKWADRGVSSGKITEWYVLLRDLQGEPGDILEAGIMIDSRDFLTDSLFCEWAYVINLDDECLEVYRGFQSEPHDKGRYANLDSFKDHRTEDNQYYPVALLASFPLGNLPEKIYSVIHYDEETDSYIVEEGG